MPENYLRAFVPEDNRSAVAAAEPGTPIPFIASTEGIKRDGLDLSVESWILDNYRKNPVVLWSHDYWGNRLPIGRGEVHKDIDADQLKSLLTFDQEDEFAKQVENKYRKGYLNAVSVGWDVIEVDGEKMLDLLDISAVVLPGDPDALIERQYRALKDLFEPNNDEGLDNKPDPKNPTKDEHWERVAAGMAELFSPECDLEDGERTSEYYRLVKEYRKLGKTPPELLPKHAVEALGEAIQGLFFEGEERFVERLQGLVELSKENKRKLKEILEEAVEILSEEEDSEEEDSENEEGNEGEPDEEELAELETVIEQLDEILEEQEDGKI